MSAEDLGARLMGEVVEEGLDEVSFFFLYVPSALYLFSIEVYTPVYVSTGLILNSCCRRFVFYMILHLQRISGSRRSTRC